MRGSVVPVALLLIGSSLLAGCSDPPETAGAPPQPSQESRHPSDAGLVVALTPTNVSLEWDLVLSETQVAGIIASSTQCEELASSTTILSGRVMATWDAPHAASERLRMVVATSTRPLASLEGASPLELLFDVPPGTDLVTVDVGTVAPIGVANDLEVHAEATLTLEGVGAVEATEVNGCPG